MSKAIITDADREAAGLLRMWQPPGQRKDMHPKVDGLIGADLCIHDLYGSGDPLEASPAYLTEYDDAPYRHHVFSQSFRDVRYCVCGNAQSSILHYQCWKGE